MERIKRILTYFSVMFLARIVLGSITEKTLILPREDYCYIIAELAAIVILTLIIVPGFFDKR